MSVIESQTTAPITTDNGDHEKFAHVVVPAASVTEAYITGTPITAVCGKTWVPTRSPEQFPVCPECKEFMKNVGRDV